MLELHLLRSSRTGSCRGSEGREVVQSFDGRRVLYAQQAVHACRRGDDSKLSHTEGIRRKIATLGEAYS